ncbi:MAG: (2Fe-2S)-binding protein [Candidatus Hodarchaeales archaeon]|jgi:carbon-monoxide dehydrogenase small subunit
MKLEITVNEKKILKDVSPDRRLLDLLREDLGLKGTKEGCAQGECGACTVLLDGKPVNSCLVLACQVNGSQVETIESGNTLLTKLKQAMVDSGGVQCGFCTPGVIMTSLYVLRKYREPDLDAIKHELSGNLCRCTGYTKIYEAVQVVISEMVDQ